MMRRLSLTARLTILYTLAAAALLLGMAGLIAVAFGANAVALINILFFASWGGSVVEALMQIRYYRRGVR